MGEFAFIAELFAPLATDAHALGLLDDASLVDLPDGVQGVVTKDVLVEGVHFLEGTDPARIAQKLLRVNLSDLAAMGAESVGYWLGVQLRKEGAREWLSRFVEGLRSDQLEFDISLMGGDTVSTPGPVSLSLTAMGQVPKGAALKRSGAQPGDRICVSGTIGDGVLGLGASRGRLDGLSQDQHDYLVSRLECPTPRLALGKALRGVASSAIDISDGLVGDAGHIAAASKVGLAIDAEKVPLSDAAKAALTMGLTGLEELLSGGDDYELLFTGLGESIKAITDAGVGVTEIGEVVSGKGVQVSFKGEEMTFPKGGFTHF